MDALRRATLAAYEVRLRQALDADTVVRITDVTDGHTAEGVKDGRALRADGLELMVICVSSCFEGLSGLERQQLVNDALGPELKTGKIHSVQMRCLTPEQWQVAAQPEPTPSHVRGSVPSRGRTTRGSEAQTLDVRLTALINKHDVVLFMKGSPGLERCGFSRAIVQLLQDQGVDFDYFDILTDEEVRQGLKEYSKWPTYPQLYSKGKLVGGLDIVKELIKSGEFKDELSSKL